MVTMRFAVAWLLVLSSSLLAQEYGFVPVPNWANPTGGPLFQDHLGRLWITSGGDVKCFDGTRFYSLRAFGPLHFNGRSSGAMAEDSDGGIWFTSDVALYRFSRGRLEVARQGWAESVVNIGPGVMLANMGSPGDHDPPELHLYRFREVDGGWRCERLADWTSRFEGVLRKDHRGNVLFACSDGWCELSRKDILTWRTGYRGDPVRHPDVYPGIESILRDRFGCLWFRGTDGAAYQCAGDGKPIKLPPEIASNGLFLSETADGTIVIPSYMGMAIGRPGTFRVFPLTSAPLTEGNLVFTAQDGTFWSGGPKGLYHLTDPRRLELWTDREGLANPRAIVRVGSQVFASSGMGVAVLSADHSRWIALPASRELGEIRSLVRGPHQTLLVVPHHNGVAQLDLDGRILARTAPDADDQAMQLTGDDGGRFWLAGQGVSRVVPEGRTIRLIPEQLPEPRTMGTDMKFEPQTRRLWACYSGGLIVKQDTGWRQITTAQGLLENLCRALLPMPSGDVWTGYFTANAFALIRPDFVHGVSVRQFYPNGDVVASNRVNAFETDRRGWIWRGTAGGLYVANAAEAETGKWLLLNQGDGLPASGVEQQALFRDDDGSIWLASGNTIGHFCPSSDFVMPKFAPRVFVSGYSWRGTSPQMMDAVKAVPLGSEITAHIGSLQFDRRNALRIRYRLAGEREWHESQSLDAPIGRFYWGRHMLEVQGRLFTGPWSVSSIQSFDILRPFWLSWPALLAYCTFGYVGVATERRRRKRHRIREEKDLPDVRDWRLEALSIESHELIATTLDERYQIERVLERGGFATVLKGFDLQQGGRPCAIKVFRHELRDKEWLARRFRQEVMALEQIHHPHVVRIFGHGTTPEGSPYLVMEFVEGSTLRDLLGAGALPVSQVVDLLQQAGAALEEIHSHGIYHRDLKPENLMIRSADAAGESLVLIDFSIAIIQDPNETVHGLSRLAGTIEYMAPEQAVGYADSTTDIYALAKVLIEMLTGMSLSTLLPKASLDLPARVRELLTLYQPGLSPESIRLISSALEFHPESRPRNARVFADTVSRDLGKLPR